MNTNFRTYVLWLVIYGKIVLGVAVGGWSLSLGGRWCVWLPGQNYLVSAS